MPVIDNATRHRWPNESNIPVLKKGRRFNSSKKPKEKEFPDLQKCIETIMKVSEAPVKSNELMTVKSMSVALTPQEKNEKKIVRTKSNKNPKASESSFKKITKMLSKQHGNRNMLIRDETSSFDDTRGGKPALNSSNDPRSTLEIESFLKKFYPNPYCLEDENDFQNLRLSARTWKYKIENSPDGGKSGKLLNMMFLRITDQPATELIFENLENKAKENSSYAHSNEQRLSHQEEEPLCIIEMCEKFIEAKKTNNLNENNSQFAKNYENLTTINKDLTMQTKGNIIKSESNVVQKHTYSTNQIQSEPKESRKHEKYKSTTKGNLIKREQHLTSFQKFSTIHKKIQSNSKETFVIRNNSNEYDLGKLSMLTIDEEEQKSGKSIVNNMVLGEETSNKIWSKNDVNTSKDYQMMEISQNLELMDIKNRPNRYKNKMEVRKLYEIVDKTTNSLQEITTRNEKELMVKKEIERINRQNALDCKFENNKFVQFIRKMHNNKNQVESDGKCRGSDASVFGIEDKPTVKPKKNSNSEKCKRDGQIKKIKKENSTVAKKESFASENEVCSYSPNKTHTSFSSCISVNKNNDYEIDSQIYNGFEMSFCVNGEGKNKFAHKLPDEFSESNKKIDEMLERMQEFLVKLDETSSSGLNANKSSASSVNENFQSLVTLPGYKDDALENSNSGETGNENISNTNVFNIEYDATEREKEGRNHDSSSHLLTIAKNVLGPITHYPNIQNENLTLPETNRVQIVEETNELGGYNEETPEETVSIVNGMPFSKNLLPLSVRIRKKKNHSSEAVKKALEKEEKLLVNHLLDVHHPSSREEIILADIPSEPDFFAFRRSRSSWNAKVAAETTLFFKSCKSQMIDSNLFTKPFGCHNSNFVICVNSHPGNIRTAKQSALQISSLYSNSLAKSGADFLRIEEQPHQCLFQSKQIAIKQDTPLENFELKPRYELLNMNVYQRNSVYYSVSPIALKFLFEYPVEINSHFMLNPIGPIKFDIVSCSTELPANLAKSHNAVIKSLALETTGSKVEGLAEATNTEMCAYETGFINPDVFGLKNDKKLPPCSIDKPFTISKEEKTQNRNEGVENEKIRVQELLIRTYNLQQKLHRQLHKISVAECPSLVPPKVSLPDLCILYDSKVKSDETASDMKKKSISAVGIDSKSMQTDPLIPLTDVQCNSQSNLIDHGTSCHSFLREKNEENKIIIDNSSSTSSFKSSKNYSEDKESMNEIANDKKKSQDSKFLEFKNLKFLRKIFSDLEVFRKCQKKKANECPEANEEIEKEGDLQTCPGNASDKIAVNSTENSLKHAKSASKVLKTIFKGKDSTTELAIGLRDVPMSNVSVEKKKFSPNHTKIFISICEEKSGKHTKPPVILPEAKHKINPYYCEIKKDWEKLPLTCHPLQVQAFSENEEESSDNDDDFKSVTSTLSQDSVLSLNKEDNNAFSDTKLVPKCTEPLIQSKPFRKHRFDFYENMSSEYDVPSTGLLTQYDVKDTRYRELEPLKKALTDRQIRMRTVKRNSFLSNNEYYDRALKLAKMSAGYCQSCGNRAVIPEDTFGYYKSILPRRYSTNQLKYFLRNTGETKSGFYSFCSSTNLSDHFCDLDMKQSSTYLLNNSVLEGSLNNLSLRYERMS